MHTSMHASMYVPRVRIVGAGNQWTDPVETSAEECNGFEFCAFLLSIKENLDEGSYPAANSEAGITIMWFAEIHRRLHLARAHIQHLHANSFARESVHQRALVGTCYKGIQAVAVAPNTSRLLLLMRLQTRIQECSRACENVCAPTRAMR